MNNFQTALVICAVVIFIGGFAYYRMQQDKTIIASIPEEFKYVYLCYSSDDFLAIDPRNKKMLLSLKDARKIYALSDIQKYEKDSHVSKSTYKGKPRRTTWYHLILHVNDPENPTWKFSSDLQNEFDCIELLVRRALDGTLPDTDERKVFDIMNGDECHLILSHVALTETERQVEQWRDMESKLKKAKDEDSRAAILQEIGEIVEKDLEKTTASPRPSKTK